jgi:hypothetical protein
MQRALQTFQETDQNKTCMHKIVGENEKFKLKMHKILCSRIKEEEIVQPTPNFRWRQDSRLLNQESPLERKLPFVCTFAQRSVCVR